MLAYHIDTYAKLYYIIMTKHAENLKIKNFMQQAEMAEKQHNRAVEQIKETLLNKLVMVGISGQGIERTFVTDVAHDFIGTIAIELSATGVKGAGLFFDAQQLRFYRKYDEEETKKFTEEFARQQATPAIMPTVLRTAEEVKP